jgi:hypothetical protein
MTHTRRRGGRRGTAVVVLIALALLATGTQTAGFDALSAERPVVASTAPDGAAHLAIAAAATGGQLHVSVRDRAGLGITDVTVTLDDGRTVTLAPAGHREWTADVPYCAGASPPTRYAVQASGPDVAVALERSLPSSGGVQGCPASALASDASATAADASLGVRR